MVCIELINGDYIRTKTGDLSFWAQRMSTTDIQLVKNDISGKNVLINPQYIAYVSEANE